MVKSIFRALVLSTALLIGGMASAYHADMTSAVNLGMVKSYSRSAINVIDETVPFIPSSMTIGPTRIGAFGSRKTTIIGINGPLASSSRLIWKSWPAAAFMP